MDLCNQDHNDERTRQDMFSGPWRLGSAIGELNDLSYIGPDAPAIDGDAYLRKDNEIFKTVQALTRLRSSCPALIYGKTVKRYESWGHRGLLAFSRVLYDPKQEVVSILNPGDAAEEIKSLNLDSQLNEGSGLKYVSVFKDAPDGVVKRGALRWPGKLKIPPKTFFIFVRADQQAEDSSLGVRLCTSAAAAAADLEQVELV